MILLISSLPNLVTNEKWLVTSLTTGSSITMSVLLTQSLFIWLLFSLLLFCIMSILANFITNDRVSTPESVRTLFSIFTLIYLIRKFNGKSYQCQSKMNQTLALKLFKYSLAFMSKFELFVLDSRDSFSQSVIHFQ